MFKVVKLNLTAMVVSYMDLFINRNVIHRFNVH